MLALVTFGLYLNKAGKSKISKENEHSIHSFLGVLSFAAETLVFLFTGIIFGVKISTLDIDGLKFL